MAITGEILEDPNEDTRALAQDPARRSSPSAAAGRPRDEGRQPAEVVEEKGEALDETVTPLDELEAELNTILLEAGFGALSNESGEGNAASLGEAEDGCDDGFEAPRTIASDAEISRVAIDFEDLDCRPSSATTRAEYTAELDELDCLMERRPDSTRSPSPAAEVEGSCDEGLQLEVVVVQKKKDHAPDETLEWLDDLEAELNSFPLAAGSKKSSRESEGDSAASPGKAEDASRGGFEAPRTIPSDAEISRVAVDFEDLGCRPSSATTRAEYMAELDELECLVERRPRGAEKANTALRLVDETGPNQASPPPTLASGGGFEAPRTIASDAEISRVPVDFEDLGCRPSSATTRAEYMAELDELECLVERRPRGAEKANTALRLVDETGPNQASPPPTPAKFESPTNFPAAKDSTRGPPLPAAVEGACGARRQSLEVVVSGTEHIKAGKTRKRLDDVEAAVDTLLVAAGFCKLSDKPEGYGAAYSGEAEGVFDGGVAEPRAIARDVASSRVAVEFEDPASRPSSATTTSEYVLKLDACDDANTTGRLVDETGSCQASPASSSVQFERPTNSHIAMDTLLARKDSAQSPSSPAASELAYNDGCQLALVAVPGQKDRPPKETSKWLDDGDAKVDCLFVAAGCDKLSDEPGGCRATASEEAKDGLDGGFEAPRAIASDAGVSRIAVEPEDHDCRPSSATTGAEYVAELRTLGWLAKHRAGACDGTSAAVELVDEAGSNQALPAPISGQCDRPANSRSGMDALLAPEGQQCIDLATTAAVKEEIEAKSDVSPIPPNQRGCNGVSIGGGNRGLCRARRRPENSAYREQDVADSDARNEGGRLVAVVSEEKKAQSAALRTIFTQRRTCALRRAFTAIGDYGIELFISGEEREFEFRRAFSLLGGVIGAREERSKLSALLRWSRAASVATTTRKADLRLRANALTALAQKQQKRSMRRAFHCILYHGAVAIAAETYQDKREERQLLACRVFAGIAARVRRNRVSEAMETWGQRTAVAKMESERRAAALFSLARRQDKRSMRFAFRSLTHHAVVSKSAAIVERAREGKLQCACTLLGGVIGAREERSKLSALLRWSRIASVATTTRKADLRLRANALAALVDKEKKRSMRQAFHCILSHGAAAIAAETYQDKREERQLLACRVFAGIAARVRRNRVSEAMETWGQRTAVAKMESERRAAALFSLARRQDKRSMRFAFRSLTHHAVVSKSAAIVEHAREDKLQCACTLLGGVIGAREERSKLSALLRWSRIASVATTTRKADLRLRANALAALVDKEKKRSTGRAFHSILHHGAAAIAAETSDARRKEKQSLACRLLAGVTRRRDDRLLFRALGRWSRESAAAQAERERRKASVIYLSRNIDKRSMRFAFRSLTHNAAAAKLAATTERARKDKLRCACSLLGGVIGAREERSKLSALLRWSRAASVATTARKADLRLRANALTALAQKQQKRSMRQAFHCILYHGAAAIAAETYQDKREERQLLACRVFAGIAARVRRNRVSEAMETWGQRTAVAKMESERRAAALFSLARRQDKRSMRFAFRSLTHHAVVSKSAAIVEHAREDKLQCACTLLGGVIGAREERSKLSALLRWSRIASVATTTRKADLRLRANALAALVGKEKKRSMGRAFHSILHHGAAAIVAETSEARRKEKQSLACRLLAGVTRRRDDRLLFRALGRWSRERAAAQAERERRAGALLSLAPGQDKRLTRSASQVVLSHGAVSMEEEAAAARCKEKQALACQLLSRIARRRVDKILAKALARWDRETAVSKAMCQRPSTAACERPLTHQLTPAPEKERESTKSGSQLVLYQKVGETEDTPCEAVELPGLSSASGAETNVVGRADGAPQLGTAVLEVQSREGGGVDGLPQDAAEPDGAQGHTKADVAAEMPVGVHFQLDTQRALQKLCMNVAAPSVTTSAAAHLFTASSEIQPSLRIGVEQQHPHNQHHPRRHLKTGGRKKGRRDRAKKRSGMGKTGCPSGATDHHIEVQKVADGVRMVMARWCDEQIADVLSKVLAYRAQGTTPDAGLLRAGTRDTLPGGGAPRGRNERDRQVKGITDALLELDDDPRRKFVRWLTRVRVQVEGMAEPSGKSSDGDDCCLENAVFEGGESLSSDYWDDVSVGQPGDEDSEHGGLTEGSQAQEEGRGEGGEGEGDGGGEEGGRRIAEEDDDEEGRRVGEEKSKDGEGQKHDEKDKQGQEQGEGREERKGEEEQHQTPEHGEIEGRGRSGAAEVDDDETGIMERAHAAPFDHLPAAHVEPGGQEKALFVFGKASLSDSDSNGVPTSGRAKLQSAPVDSSSTEGGRIKRDHDAHGEAAPAAEQYPYPKMFSDSKGGVVKRESFVFGGSTARSGLSSSERFVFGSSLSRST